MIIAKDGTNRGGRRVRAGDKPKPLNEKINNGKLAKILDIPTFSPESMLVVDEEYEGANLTGMDMPEPSDYLSERQKDGMPLGADIIFRETWEWLKERNCEKFVSPRLLESYSQYFARYIQCERAISKYGLL